MKKNKQSGYDMTFNSPMAVSQLMTVATEQEREAIVAAHSRYVGSVIRDGMGGLVPTSDLRPLMDIVFEPGVQLPNLEGLSAEQVKAVIDICNEEARKHWVGEGRLGMTTIGSRLSQIREAASDLDLPAMDLPPHLMIFGKTSTGMTSPSMNSVKGWEGSSAKPRGKKSRKHRT